jgi:hypothetical protein
MADPLFSHLFSTWLGSFDPKNQALYIKVSGNFANTVEYGSLNTKEQRIIDQFLN